MKGLYITYSFILAFTVLVFAQRAIFWACKRIGYTEALKRMRPSNERYAVINCKLTNAKIHTVCWILIDLMALFSYFDCLAQIFRG